MNNELTESENALNCIIENYVNEIQRNTCDDDEEDMRICQEKIYYITSLKKIVFKDLEVLELLKRKINIGAEFDAWRQKYISTFYGILTDEEKEKIKEWLNGKD